MAVQFCGTCGHPLIPDQLFCQHCGSRVDEHATRSAPPVTPGITVAPPGTPYCGECGAPVGNQDRVCRRCGAPVEPPSGGVSDASLSDLPTRMGTPPPPLLAQPVSQVSPAFQAPPAYPAPAVGESPQAPPPNYANQPPSAWGASYTPGPYDESPTYTFGGARPGVQAPPRPTGPGGPPRQGARWPLVLALVLVAIALIAGGGIFLLLANSGKTAQGGGSNPTTTPVITPTTGITVTPIPSPTAVVLNTDTATALVRQYFADINAKQYDAAYDLLSTEWQQTQSRQDFITGYQNTVKDTLTINSAEQLPNGTIEVDVYFQAQNIDKTVNYAGYYLVTKENGKLVLLKAHINQQ